MVAIKDHLSAFFRFPNQGHRTSMSHMLLHQHVIIWSPGAAWSGEFSYDQMYVKSERCHVIVKVATLRSGGVQAVWQERLWSRDAPWWLVWHAECGSRTTWVPRRHEWLQKRWEKRIFIVVFIVIINVKANLWIKFMQPVSVASSNLRQQGALL